MSVKYQFIMRNNLIFTNVPEDNSTGIEKADVTEKKLRQHMKDTSKSPRRLQTLFVLSVYTDHLVNLSLTKSVQSWPSSHSFKKESPYDVSGKTGATQTIACLNNFRRKSLQRGVS